MKINKTAVDGLPIPKSGYDLLWDSSLKGFGVRVTASGVKSFILQYRSDGKSRRVTLGRYGPLTVESARKQALTRLGQIAAGNDPVTVKVKGEVRTVTLREVFGEYIKARSLKPLTIRDMAIALQGLSDWMDKPLVKITREMVSRRHKKLGELSEPPPPGRKRRRGSEARANLTFRYLRGLFNFAAALYTDGEGKPLITDNPVKRLSDTRAWYRIERRQTMIKPHQLKPWIEAVLSLKNDRITSTFETVGDFLMLVLLTGLRRSEAESLRWDQVDFEAKTLTILDTKNHEAHTLPLSDYLFDLLTWRKPRATNEYVFTNSHGKGYLREPRKPIKWVTDKSGVKFTIHDLRRTFATVADSLDIPGYAVKMLLNHKANGDVTAGYIVRDVERLRGPMQRITDYMLEMGGIEGEK
ncbi:tyrosine-type recombinase/integrase [Candidatus Neomarinimicrobiota bacterium]